MLSGPGACTVCSWLQGSGWPGWLVAVQEGGLLPQVWTQLHRGRGLRPGRRWEPQEPQRSLSPSGSVPNPASFRVAGRGQGGESMVPGSHVKGVLPGAGSRERKRESCTLDALGSIPSPAFPEHSPGLLGPQSRFRARTMTSALASRYREWGA